MSLRAKLFVGIGLTLCVVLGSLVALTLLGERGRVARMDAFRSAALQFAGSLAMSTSPESLPDTVLARPDGTLHPELRSLGMYRKGDGNTLVQVWAGGALKEDPADQDRAQALVEQ